jgi:bacteriocin biosynthesis cyclodehydratase domain-containing protein
MGESLADRPLLKPWYRVSLDANRAVLRYAGSVLEFEGGAATRLLPHLLPLLDGRRTVDEVVEQLGEPIRPAVERALDLLREHRLLTDGLPDEIPDGERRTLEGLAAIDPYGRSPGELRPRLAAARAVVVGDGATADEIERVLRASAVGSVVRGGWDALPSAPETLSVVAPAPDDVPLVAEWNRAALAERRRWLQVLPFDGLLAAVGPLFVPGETSCHECYRLRRNANVTSIRDAPGPPQQGRYPSAPAIDAAVAALAALTALRLLVLDDGRPAGVLLAVELASGPACSQHVVYRVPRCPACSRAVAQASPAPWTGVGDVAA